MPHFSQELLSKIIDALDFVALAQRYVHLEKKGGRYWGLSPFKVEKTPSFSIEPEKKLYYCFSTGQGGTPFTLIQKLEHVSFYDAVVLVAKAAHIDIGQDKSKSGTRDDVRNEVLQLLTRLSSTASYFLNNKEGVFARNYLADRGISQKSIEQFKLGYLPKGDWTYSFLKSKQYSDSLLASTGLFSKKNPHYCLMQGRLIFPLIDKHGQTLGFGGRTLDDNGPKYINSAETPYFRKRAYLYGFTQYIAHKEEFRKNKRALLSKSAIITEGYFDVIALHQAGIYASFAPLGTAFTQDHTSALGQHFSEIALLFDSDTAGKQASYRAAIELEHSAGIEVKICNMRSKDAADILRLQGEESLRAMVLKRESYIDYLLNSQKSMTNESTRERAKKIRTVLRYVAAIQEPLKVSLYIERISDFYGILKEEVRALIQEEKRTRTVTGMFEQRSEDERHASGGPVSMDDEILALCAVLYCPQLFTELRKNISAEALENPHARILYNKMEFSFRVNQKIELQSIIDMLPATLADRVNKAVLRGEVATNPEAMVSNFLKRAKKRRYRKRAQEINMQLRQLVYVSDEKERKRKTKALLEEKKFIDIELNSFRK